MKEELLSSEYIVDNLKLFQEDNLRKKKKVTNLESYPEGLRRDRLPPKC